MVISTDLWAHVKPFVTLLVKRAIQIIFCDIYVDSSNLICTDNGTYRKSIHNPNTHFSFSPVDVSSDSHSRHLTQ